MSKIFRLSDGNILSPEDLIAKTLGGNSQVIATTFFANPQPYKLVADTATYSLTGNNLIFPYQYRLISNTSSYSVTGNSAAFSISTGSIYTLVANTATYSLSGNSADGILTPAGGNIFLGRVSADWGTAANWTRNAVPTISDDVYFTSISGNALIQTTSRNCAQLITTGYTGTITITGSSVIFNVASNVTLSSGTTITGTGSLSFGAASSATLTRNGATISTTFRVGSGALYTLGDAWVVGNITFVAPGRFDNFSITTTGNLTMTANSGVGTAEIILTGTGTWSGTGSLQHPLTINTSGTITLSGAITINGSGIRNFTRTSGTLVATGSTLTLNGITLIGDFSGVNFNNIILVGTTITFSSNMTLLGDLSYTGTGTSTTVGNYTMSVAGSITHTSSGTLTGTINLVMNGTGTLSSTSTGAIRLNLTINTSGTITLGSSLIYNTGTFTHISGTVINTGNTLTIGASTTLNTSGMTWNNVSIGVATVTLSSDLKVSGTLTNTSTAVINGFNTYISGSLNNSSSTLSGSTKIIFNGTGSITSGASAQLGGTTMDVEINTTGTITINLFRFQGRNLTYVSGTVVNTDTLELVANSPILNTNGITWNNISFATTLTLTLNSLLSANSLLLPNANITFTGTSGFSVNNLTNSTLSTSSKTQTFQTGVTYIVNNSVSLIGTSSFILTLTSSSSTTRANLKLTYSGTQSIRNVNATRIDSSGGEALYTTVNNTLTDTINWGKREGSTWWHFIN